MNVAANELIEVYSRDGKAHVDTQGERKLSSDDCFALASRLIDTGMQVEERCPLLPFWDQIVVRVIVEEGRVTGGGVHLPDNMMEPALRGVILAVGPQANKDEKVEPVMVGDLVTFSRHAGIETVVGDKRYLTMKSHYALTKIVLDG
jgi:co-chaperonin GroES (HSP10)